MKKKSKGFMLLETLIVSVSISGILIYLYMQFSTVNDSYHKSFKYNSVESLYKNADIKENIILNGLDQIYTDADNNIFVDLSGCQSTYFNNNAYCKELYNILDVKTVLLTKGDITQINNSMKTTQNINKYSETIRNFMEKIAASDSDYQLIVEYNDNHVAAIDIKR